MKRALVAVFALVADLALAAPALADPTGPEILQKVDRALNAFKDGVFESKLHIKEPDGKAREFSFVTYQKAPEKRLVRFSAPGDVKGMGVLIENRDTMYVFLPGYQRVRRMGTHIKNQTFMGSDFSFEDMSQLAYSTSYDAKLVGAEENNWLLELTVHSGIETDYPKMKLWADKTMFQPTKIEYYDGAGKKLKTQLRSEYKKDGPDHFSPGKIVIIDHRRNDHASEIEFLSTKINTGLADDLFTQRALVRGQ